MSGGERHIFENSRQERPGQIDGLQVHIEGEMVLVAQLVLEGDEVDICGDYVSKTSSHSRERYWHNWTSIRIIVFWNVNVLFFNFHCVYSRIHYIMYKIKYG